MPRADVLIVFFGLHFVLNFKVDQPEPKPYTIQQNLSITTSMPSIGSSSQPIRGTQVHKTKSIAIFLDHSDSKD